MTLLMNTATNSMAEDKLAPCPDKPNCVSSLATEDKQKIAPMSYDGNRATAHLRLLAALSKLKNTEIVEDSHPFLHVKITSTLWNFIDDVSFFFDDENKLIHMRSASRSGYYDFGVNRRRLENIRALYAQQ